MDCVHHVSIEYKVHLKTSTGQTTEHLLSQWLDSQVVNEQLEDTHSFWMLMMSGQDLEVNKTEIARGSFRHKGGAIANQPSSFAHRVMSETTAAFEWRNSVQMLSMLTEALQKQLLLKSDPLMRSFSTFFFFFQHVLCFMCGPGEKTDT